MPLNIENINTVIEAIKTAETERFRMSTFIHHPRKLCSTAACIAGWAMLVFHKPKIMSFKYDSLMYEDIAKDDFGITEEQANELFYMIYKDDLVHKEIAETIDCPFDLSHFDRLKPEVRQAAAINVLTILRDTDKVDWLTAIQQAKATHA